MSQPQSRSSLFRERMLPVVVLLFIGSGCAALIYEIVWFQLLQLVIGSSAVSLGVLLGTFMGGMCLGSLLLPRLFPACSSARLHANSSRRHPLVVYAFLELGIASCGIALLWLLPYVDRLYVAGATSGWVDIVLRALLAAVCLLPPTLLMGATLPAVARWVEATPRGVSWLGFFYGGNIAGAVCGCLLAGFYLLRVYDMVVATHVAAAINVAVAVVAMLLANAAGEVATESFTSTEAARPSRPVRSIYLVIALSGLTALGAEVVWTRLLSLLIGGTVYAFSIILAVFLIGLGIGSSAGAALANRGNARAALGVCQLLLAPAIAWAAYQITSSLPYWPIDPALPHNPWDGFQLDIVRCLWVILPAAVLWGASFPLALAAATQSETVPSPRYSEERVRDGDSDPLQPLTPALSPEYRGEGENSLTDSARLVGGIYAANTIGAILGALGFSLAVIGYFGTQHAQQGLVGLAALSGVIALAPYCSQGHPKSTRALATAGLSTAILLTGWLINTLPKTPDELIAHGRYLPIYGGSRIILEAREGLNSSVAVSTGEDLSFSFHVSGKVEASSLRQDMRLQRMLGHIPALVHPAPKSVLIVGCGAGVTSGSFVVHPSVERIVICEIEPLIPQVVAKYFKKENNDVVNNPRVEIVYDDARHFIRTTREQFDVITSDPIHPWVKGAATLYTREYFELCRARLKPGGVISQWVPLYESSPATVKSELATFFAAFPEGTVWSNDQSGRGYDVVLLAQAEPIAIDVDGLVDRLDQADHYLVAESLDEVGLYPVLDLLGTYAASAADLTEYLSDAEINYDRNLRLQYLAGLSSGHTSEVAIHDDIVRSRTYPEKLFKSSPEAEFELQDLFARKKKRVASKKA